MPSMNTNPGAVGPSPGGIPMGGDSAPPGSNPAKGRSPPDDHHARMVMGGGYPGYPPPGFPPYPMSSSPPQGERKGQPQQQPYGYPQGGFPPNGMPPYGQPYPPYPGSSGFPPYPPSRGPWYGGNYPHSGEAQGFPGQSPQPTTSGSSRSTRGGRSSLKLPYSPPSLSIADKQEISNDTASKLPKPEELSTRKMDDLEAERLRNTAAAEQRLSEVKPIQTDFHFFVKDMQTTLKQAAEDEVRKSLESTGKDASDLDPFLVYSNLNGRLLRAWEELSKEKRDKYMEKEEEDRRRFMEEDEVASRHCFTLTARVRSEQRKDSPDKATERGDDKLKRSPADPSEDESPPKKNKLNDDEGVVKSEE